jgi:hypothetical protein
MLKNYLLLILTFLCVFHTQAQQVRFAYDNSGNRAHQEVIIVKSGELPENLSEKTDTTMLQVQIASDVINIKLYPNPVRETLTIDCPDELTTHKINLKVYSAIGLPVFQSALPDNLCQIDLSGVDPGIYFLTISINHSDYTYKIIKQ